MLGLAFQIPPHVVLTYDTRMIATMIDVLEERAEAADNG